MAATINTREELPNLDVLRAIAVLLVLVDHCLATLGQQLGLAFDPYTWYLGRLGVLMFFVHTSYVLMASLQRLRLEGWALARSFLIRRVFRIYPLSLLCVVAVVLFKVPILPWETYTSPTVPAFASNLLLTMNVTDTQPVLAPLWTLPLEMQMYLVLPAIFLITVSVTSLRRTWVLYAIAVALAWFLPQLTALLSGALFVPCFMAGVLAYALRSSPQRLPGWSWCVFLLGVIAIYIAVEDATPGVHHGLLQWLICLAIGLAIPLFRQTSDGVLNRCAQWIAKYSYGIYLFHCIALWIACYQLPLPLGMQWGCFVLLLVAMSVGSYHWLEQPAIRLGAKLARGRFVPQPQPASAAP